METDKKIKYKGLHRAGYITCSVIFGVTLSVLCVFIATYMMAFNRSIYHNSMVREDMEFFNVQGFTQEELDYIMDDVLKYLNDGREILDTAVEGFEGELYTETEISHMVDVKAIFTAIKWITIVCALLAPLSFVGAIFIDRQRYREKHRRIFLFTLIGNAVFAGLVVLFMFINFDDIFILFHKLLFPNNEDWWLYSTDILIEMQPGNHFMRMGLYISAAYVSLLLLFFLIGFFQKQIGAFFKRVFKMRNIKTAL